VIGANYVLFPWTILLPTLDRTCAKRLRAFRPAHVASRWQAALTALAFVLSSLFGLLHEATTKHVRCAQHGEMIDSNATIAQAARHEIPATPATPTRSANAEDRDLTPRVRDLPGVAMHGHEHCLLISAMRESRVMPRSPAIMPAPVAISRLLASTPRVVIARGDDLYRTAPKTSPPA
jgi:hypothetical protein